MGIVNMTGLKKNTSHHLEINHESLLTQVAFGLLKSHIYKVFNLLDVMTLQLNCPWQGFGLPALSLSSGKDHWE